MTPDQLLAAGLDALGLTLTAVQQAQLMQLLSLIEKWGRVYNLTAIRDPAEGVSLHLLDSLLVLPHLNDASAILDVATGAGFPGLPLAIACPDRQFCLLDRSAKKIRFVRQAVMELGLLNVTAVASRVEDFVPLRPFDAILARAFARLDVIRALVAPLLAPKGRILALKGHLPGDEWGSLEVASAQVHRLVLPGSPVTRHVVVLR